MPLQLGRAGPTELIEEVTVRASLGIAGQFVGSTLVLGLSLASGLAAQAAAEWLAATRERRGNSVEFR